MRYTSSLIETVTAPLCDCVSSFNIMMLLIPIPLQACPQKNETVQHPEVERV
jgi:hypothetical protein